MQSIGMRTDFFSKKKFSNVKAVHSPPDFGRGRAIEVSKTPVPYTNFSKCIPDFIPIFQKYIPDFIPIFRKCIPDTTPIVKITKIDTVPYTFVCILNFVDIPKSRKSTPFPMARPRTQNMYSTPPPQGSFP